MISITKISIKAINFNVQKKKKEKKKKEKRKFLVVEIE